MGRQGGTCGNVRLNNFYYFIAEHCVPLAGELQGNQAIKKINPGNITLYFEYSELIGKGVTV